MNDQRNNASPPANIGISLLLVVFLILCLFTFSAIALVQAENEWHQANLTMQSQDAYYKACNEAESDLAKLNDELSGDLTDIETTIKRTYTLSDIASLSVVFKFDTRLQAYKFSKFQTVSTLDWQGDDSVNVIR